MHFHDLQHGAAAVLLNNGSPLKEDLCILGHTTVRMTADTYGHLSDDMRRDCGERIQRAMGGT